MREYIEGKLLNTKVDSRELPARLFSLVMSMIISVVCVITYLPQPINFISALSIICGMGYTIINTISHNR